MKTILSTKILDIEVKNLLLQNNFKVIEHDFIAINFNKNVLQPIENNVIITSKNAIYSLENYSKVQLQLFCVGLETQKLLISKGFKVVETAKNGESLAKIIVNQYSNSKFTYFCSDIRRDIIPNILQKNNIDYQEIIAYKTILQPFKISEKIDIILFFSPSGVNSYLYNNKINNELCVCIGKTTAQELESIAQHIFISSSSIIKEMVFEIIKIF